MPFVPLEDYLQEQQKKQGLAFLSRIQASGVNVEQFRHPKGGFFFPITEFPQGAVTASEPEPPGLISGALQRGTLTVGQDLASAAALASEGLGLEGPSAFFQHKASTYATRANAIPSSVPSFEQVQDIGDLGTYIAERSIEQIPLLASLMIPGGAAATVARLAGAGARAARGAGWTAAYLSDVGLQTGESAQIAREAGDSPVDLRVVGSGIGKAFLDFLPIVAVAKSIGLMPIIEKNIIARLAEAGYLKRVAGNALLLSATEVPTEVAQEAWNIGLDRALREKGGDLTDEEWSQLLNAATGALAVGIGLSPALGIGRPRIASREETHPPEIPTGEQFGFPGFPPGGPTGPVVQEEPLSTAAPQAQQAFEFGPQGIVRPLVSTEASVLDGTRLYNDKGELESLGEEYRKVLAEANRQLAFDPASDQIIGKDYSKTWRKVNPNWEKTSETTFQLGEEAQISQSPKGFEVWASAGVNLGVFPDLSSAMRRGEEYSWQRTPFISILEGELRVLQPLAGERVAADEARRNPTPTATEAKIVQLEEARTQADRRPDEFEPLQGEQVLLAQADPGMQRLLELRADTLADKDLQRKDNGGLTVRGLKLVSNIETRIGNLAARLGIQNPVAPAEVEIGQGNIEERLSMIAQAAERAKAQPRHPNLSLAESRLLDKLEEKENVEALTEQEYARMEILQTKVREGSDRPFFKKLTKADIQELETELNRIDREEGLPKVLAEEVRRTLREGEGTQVALDEKGDYLFSRVKNVVQLPKFDVAEAVEGSLWSVTVDRRAVGYIGATADGKFIAYRPASETSSFPSKELQEPFRGMWRRDQARSVPQESGSRSDTSFQLFSASGTSFGFKHPEAILVEKTVKRGKDILSQEWTLGTEDGRDLGTFVTEEEAKNFAQNYFAPASTQRSDILGEFATLREAAATIRRDAIQQPGILKSGRAAGLRQKFKSLTREQVMEAIFPIYTALKIRPQIRISYLNEFSGEELKHANEAAGLFTLKRAGEVTLIPDNIFSKTEAQETFVHEVLAHFGLRTFFSPEELEAILREVSVYRTKEILAARTSEGSFSGREGAPITLLETEEFIARKTEEAWLRWKQGERDWMRDKEYEPPGSRTFVGKIIAMVQRWLRSAGIRIGKDRWTDVQIASMMKDVGLFLSGKIVGRNPHGVRVHFTTEPMKRTAGRANLAEAVPNMDSFMGVWGARFATTFLTPIQIAEKYNLPGVAKYLETLQFWWARKRDLTVDAVNIALDWQKLPKREVARLSQAILEIDAVSTERGVRLTDGEVAAILKDFGVGETAADLYRRMDTSFRTMLDQLQFGLELNALREHTRDKDQAKALHKLWREGKHQEFFSESKKILGNLEVGGRLTQIETEMNELRNRNYFPHMRFGKYGLYIRAKEDLSFRNRSYRGPREDKKGQVVYFETFENYSARDSRTRDLLSEFPARRFDVGYGIVSDQEFTFLGMPPSLYETLLKDLKLKEEQVERLKELYFTRSPGRSFLKHLTKRRGTEGFSEDILRVYSAYMMNAANHIARVEFHLDLGNAISEIRAAGQELGDVAGIIRDYFGDHFDYIMNPETDWAQLRALGFLWYLGFNPKSALVNLTQVPMVAYPYLASLYGDKKVVAELTKAYGTVTRLWRGKSVLDDAAQVDMERATREGFINESYATELAALAEAPVLQRLLPQSKHGKLLANVSYYGAWMFQKAELYNRQVVFLAARELAIQSGLKGEDVFLAARKAVQTTMFEYAKWNRPKFMRGRRSVFFLFWSYIQHLSFLAFGGQGRGTAIRTWSLLLLVAGLQGLPFAEDALDLIDLGSTKVKELLGSKDPKTDLRLEIRELTQTLTDQPDLIMHGLSRYYGLGPLHLMQLLGVPVPGVDVSGSIGAGRTIPGVQSLATYDRDPDRRLGQAVVDLLGPVAGTGFGLMKAMMSQDPDQWKVWERAMPAVARNASSAVRRWSREAETFRGGGKAATFDPHDWSHRGELIANALGFQPTRLTSRYELRSAQEELKRYWTVRRAMVLENYAYAWLAKDPEAMADARDALRRYNNDAPMPGLRVTSDTLEKSITARLRRADLRTEGLPAEDAFQPLYRNVSRLFPAGESQSSQPSISP